MTTINLVLLLTALAIILVGARSLYCGHKKHPGRRAVQDRRAYPRSTDRRITR